jgi:hypothetical protein
MLADCRTQPSERATSCLLSHRAIQASLDTFFAFAIDLRAILSIVALTEHHMQQRLSQRQRTVPRDHLSCELMLSGNREVACMMRALLIQLPSGPVQLIRLPSARIVSDPNVGEARTW